ncbi:MAG TPA: hypothetical protein VF618_05710 [Thermoanaerobaculia bacterium]
MKKTLSLFVFATVIASQAFATYVVILKDGTTYKAKAKWTVVNGKALVQLESGGSLQLDPSLIDVAKSEQMTKLGISNAKLLDLDPNMPNPQNKNQQPSLGDQVRLRNLSGTAGQKPAAAPAPATTTPGTTTPAATLPAGGGTIDPEIVEKFDRAYDNVGIFEKKLISTSGRSLRAELVADSEDKVFNALSATSFLMVRNAGVTGAQIDLVEVYMKTTNGGAAGRFQMTRADAEAIDQKKMTLQDYFVRKVIY